MIATSYYSLVFSAYIVQDVKLLTLNSLSWPVIKLQFYNFCCIYHASRRNGAMYIPLLSLGSYFSYLMAADVLPELVGPWW